MIFSPKRPRSLLDVLRDDGDLVPAGRAKLGHHAEVAQVRADQDDPLTLREGVVEVLHAPRHDCALQVIHRHSGQAHHVVVVLHDVADDGARYLAAVSAGGRRQHVAQVVQHRVAHLPVEREDHPADYRAQTVDQTWGHESDQESGYVHEVVGLHSRVCGRCAGNCLDYIMRGEVRE